MRQTSLVLRLDQDGELFRINYSDEVRDSHLSQPLDVAKKIYKALKLFNSLIYHRDNMFVYKMKEGKLEGEELRERLQEVSFFHRRVPRLRQPARPALAPGLLCGGRRWRAVRAGRVRGLGRGQEHHQRAFGQVGVNCMRQTVVGIASQPLLVVTGTFLEPGRRGKIEFGKSWTLSRLFFQRQILCHPC